MYIYCNSKKLLMIDICYSLLVYILVNSLAIELNLRIDWNKIAIVSSVFSLLSTVRLLIEW